MLYVNFILQSKKSDQHFGDIANNFVLNSDVRNTSVQNFWFKAYRFPKTVSDVSLPKNPLTTVLVKKSRSPVENWKFLQSKNSVTDFSWQVKQVWLWFQVNGLKIVDLISTMWFQVGTKRDGYVDQQLFLRGESFAVWKCPFSSFSYPGFIRFFLYHWTEVVLKSS